MIEKEVIEVLYSMRQSMTQAKMGKELGLSQPGVQALLSGKRKIANLRLSSVERMFPNARLILSLSDTEMQVSRILLDFCSELEKKIIFCRTIPRETRVDMCHLIEETGKKYQEKFEAFR